MIHILHRGLHTSAVVVAADDDVRHFEHIDRILDDAHHGHVRAYHLVRDISRDEDFTGIEAHDPISRDSRIGAADPQDLRRLARRHAIKVVLVLLHFFLDPPPVVLEDRFELLVGGERGEPRGRREGVGCR